MLPKGWTRSTLGEIARISSGGTPSRSEPSYWGGEIPWVTTGEIQFNTIEDTTEKITEAGLKNSSAKIFPAGTLLMAMYGQGKTRGQVAKLGIQAATNQACAAIALDADNDPEYFFQYLTSEYEKLRDLSNAGAQMNLSAGILKSFLVSVPPVAEQRLIARILATWDKAIATTKQLLINSLRQKEVLVGDLTNGRHGLDVPWGTFTLGDLGRPYSGLSGKSGEDFGRGSKFIPYTNVFRNYRVAIKDFALVMIADGERQSKVEFGDILFTTSSETPHEVGMASVLLDEVEELFLNSFCFGYRLNNFNTLLPEYAGYVFRAPHMRALMTQIAQGSTRFNISKTNVMRMKLKLPPVDEQRRIVSILDVASSMEANLNIELARLKQEKSVLMAQLLTGKRRVRLLEADMKMPT